MTSVKESENKKIKEVNLALQSIPTAFEMNRRLGNGPIIVLTTSVAVTRIRETSTGSSRIHNIGVCDRARSIQSTVRDAVLRVTFGVLVVRLRGVV